jgi:hypothetical protein
LLSVRFTRLLLIPFPPPRDPRPWQRRRRPCATPASLLLAGCRSPAQTPTHWIPAPTSLLRTSILRPAGRLGRHGSNGTARLGVAGRFATRGSDGTARLGLAGRFTSRGLPLRQPLIPAAHTAPHRKTLAGAKLQQQEGMAPSHLLLRRRRPIGRQLLESAHPSPAPWRPLL